MINLLPIETKQDILYARRNTKLLHWCVALVLAMIGAGLIISGGFLYTQRSIQAINNQNVQANNQLQSQKLEETQKKVQDISNHLKLVVQVLSREVLFSKLLQQIGSIVPSKAILTDLKISKAEGGIDLTAIAADHHTATQVLVNAQDTKNKIFDQADLLNITCGATSTTDPRYPCTVTIRARFAKDNSFLFIKPSSTGTKP